MLPHCRSDRRHIILQHHHSKSFSSTLVLTTISIPICLRRNVFQQSSLFYSPPCTVSKPKARRSQHFILSIYHKPDTQYICMTPSPGGRHHLMSGPSYELDSFIRPASPESNLNSNSSPRCIFNHVRSPIFHCIQPLQLQVGPAGIILVELGRSLSPSSENIRHSCVAGH